MQQPPQRDEEEVEKMKKEHEFDETQKMRVGMKKQLRFAQQDNKILGLEAKKG